MILAASEGIALVLTADKNSVQQHRRSDIVRFDCMSKAFNLNLNFFWQYNLAESEIFVLVSLFSFSLFDCVCLS